MHFTFIILNMVALYCNNNVNSGLGLGRVDRDVVENFEDCGGVAVSAFV